jgi:uncharacterized protein YdeI (YjbR/CyaY-like superfamily)
VKPRFFRSAAELRAWLERRHASERELWVGFHEKGSGRTGIGYAEALDEALCFGWIDGVRKGTGEGRYTIRFSPRRPRSVWSEANVARARALATAGRMRPPGVTAFEARDRAQTRRYSNQRRSRGLDAASERAFRANPRAWAFYRAQPPSYRRTSSWWVTSAEREDTRARRLDALIRCSANAERIPLLSPPRVTRERRRRIGLGAP